MNRHKLVAIDTVMEIPHLNFSAQTKELIRSFTYRKTNIGPVNDAIYATI